VAIARLEFIKANIKLEGVVRKLRWPTARRGRDMHRYAQKRDVDKHPFLFSLLCSFGTLACRPRGTVLLSLSHLDRIFGLDQAIVLANAGAGMG